LGAGKKVGDRDIWVMANGHGGLECRFLGPWGLGWLAGCWQGVTIKGDKGERVRAFL
jgi:hypothetical protein